LHKHPRHESDIQLCNRCTSLLRRLASNSSVLVLLVLGLLSTTPHFAPISSIFSQFSPVGHDRRTGHCVVGIALSNPRDLNIEFPRTHTAERQLERNLLACQRGRWSSREIWPNQNSGNAWCKTPLIPATPTIFSRHVGNRSPHGIGSECSGCSCALTSSQWSSPNRPLRFSCAKAHLPHRVSRSWACKQDSLPRHVSSNGMAVR
jgi:hypothetical protein